jgi:uncharacterized protein involved in response to NO
MCSCRKTYQNRKWRVDLIWDAPHRPLFLASFLSAFLAVAWWPLGSAVGLPDPAFTSPVLWHIHELLFGFAAAAVGGYLLTALPSWTGQSPVRGAALKWLVLLWAVARLATAFADYFALPLLILANNGYFLLLATILGRQILSARVYGKLVFCIAIVLLGTAETLFLTAAVTGRPWISLTLAHVAVIGFALLMVSIAGRAIPAFTRNWFGLSGRTDMRVTDAPRGRLLAQVLLAAAMVGWLAGWPALAHGALVCAALAILWMMRGWKTVAVLRTPLLAALHLAFLWVPVGLGAIGLLWFFPAAYPVADAIHTITIGGMGGLIMAIAGRAASHRDRGDMKAGLGFVIGVVMIWLAALIRLSVPLFPNYGMGILMGAAIFWCIAWAAFIAGFLPAAFGPAVRPVLSGKKHLIPDNLVTKAEGNR